MSSHSFDTSVSFSGGGSFARVGGKVTVGFDYNSSTSTKTMNSSVSTFAESTGVVVNRGIDAGGPASTSAYLYEGETYIFGQLAPVGAIQDDITQKTTVKSQGFLTLAYVADPVSTGLIESGNWWKQAYTPAPDVALNHPQRWLQKEGTGVNPQQVKFNCPIGFSSSLNSPACTAKKQRPTPNNVADALFYQIKGLFVTPGSSTSGPQIQKAAAGDTVTLRARVYNYSLANMPAGTSVFVQFYAQPWDPISGAFKSVTSSDKNFAPAVFIGQETLQPIPSFCGGSSGPEDPCNDPNAPRNWVFATTQWDTSKLPAEEFDTYWKFWVAVWMENNAELVPEITDHGLKSIPGTNLNSLADVPIETYSNNLGFYNQVFTLTSEAKFAVLDESVFLETTILPNETSLLLDETAIVQASHTVNGSNLDDVTVLFYDGDPEQQGELIDMEIIPRIQSDSPFTTRIPFQPRSCGSHILFVEAIPSDGALDPVMDAAFFHVTINPGEALTTLIRSIGTLELPKGMKKQLINRLKNARKMFRRGKTDRALEQLAKINATLEKLSGKTIPLTTAADLQEEVNRVILCVG